MENKTMKKREDDDFKEIEDISKYLGPNQRSRNISP